MARPAPPEDAVVAVFEAKHYDGLTYTQLVDWTNGHTFEGMTQEAWQWDPITRATACRWYQDGLQWWLNHQRLSPDEEYAGLRIGLDYVANELVREYRAGRLEVDKFAKLAIQVSAEIRTLTGAGRAAADPDEVVEPPERAQLAIVRMLERQEARGGRKRLG